MSTNRKTKPDSHTVPFQFRVRPSLLAEYRAVLEREERTPSQDLRFYMASRVDEAQKEAA